MASKISEHYPQIQRTSGTATEHLRFKIPQHKGDVAIIPAYSRNICGSCNRFRITADGKIRNCLYSKTEHDILELLRKQAKDEDIAHMIYTALSQKHIDGWSAQKEHTASNQNRTSMSQIGG